MVWIVLAMVAVWLALRSSVAESDQQSGVSNSAVGDAVVGDSPATDAADHSDSPEFEDQPFEESAAGAGLVISFERLQQIEQTERLAAVGQLSAGIAHEINNPVAYIDSNLKELQQDFGSLHDFIRSMDSAAELIGRDHPATEQMIQAYRKHRIGEVLQFMPERLDDAVQGIERIGQIVRDMKRLVRGGHGPKVECHINEELQAILNIAHTRIKGGLKLEAELLETSPVIVCNASQIGQVILNILVNAIQAVNPENGHILLQERLLERELELTITDNGPGMTDAVRQQIFEPFFTTKENDEGTGMGLPLSLQLVREHNGRIELESEPGKGTSFRIYLPLSQEENSDV